uniref:Uncharacterized protein n=1 Tax=Anguilla anguilla TaxID=7936 RepID=A0A0E9WPU7_ANGAN
MIRMLARLLPQQHWIPLACPWIVMSKSHLVFGSAKGGQQKRCISTLICGC